MFLWKAHLPKRYVHISHHDDYRPPDWISFLLFLRKESYPAHGETWPMGPSVWEFVGDEANTNQAGYTAWPLPLVGDVMFAPSRDARDV
jgi:hypothetical protein